MKKLSLLLVALLSFAGATKAETLTENFNGDLPTGWSIVGDLSHNSDRARSGKGIWTSSKSDNANYLITEAVEGSITFYARAYNKNTAAYVFIYAYDGSALGERLYMSSNMRTSSTPSFSSYTANLGSYKGQIAIALNYTAIDDVTYTQKEATEGPALIVKDGSAVESPYSYNFGLTTSGTTKTFTLSNPGTADLGVSVSETGNFGATLSAATIAAGGEVTLTVTMPDATGSSEVTITPASGSGIDPFVINVSGTVRDPNKVYLDFSDGQIPDGWTSVAIGSYASSYGSEWTASTGYVGQSGSSSSYEWAFTSPMLTFANGETILFETQKYSSSNWYTPSIKVEYSIDNSTWTTIGSAFTDDTNDTWTSRSITIPVDGVKYIRFSGWYIKLRNIYGGEVANEPNMKVTQPASLDFGVITEPTQKTFTIANTGKATLEGINVTSSNDIFTVSGAPTSLAAGESAEVTITMAATTTGALSSDITVSATGMENVQFTVTGTVLPEGMPVVDFNDNQLPAGWGNNASNKWSFADGKAYCTSAAELTTPKLQFAEGDIIAITITSYDDYDNNYLEITGSTDGSTWDAFTAKKFVSRSQIPYGSYATLIVSDIPTTVKYLKFKGYYVRIDQIAGLKFSADAPVLGYYTDFECTAAATATVTKDFGFVTETPAAQVYYIKNDGTGTMNIALGNVPAGFTAALGVASLAAGESTTLTINMPAATKGYHGGDIVVTATNSSNEQIGTFTVTATGVMIEEGKLNLDFASDAIPATWTATNWQKDGDIITTGYSSSASLTTSTLTAVAGETLVVVAKNSYTSSSYTFGVKYKKVGAEGDFEDLIPAANLGTSWVMLTGSIAEAGDYLLQFNGGYAQIQRIYGLAAVAVPFMEITATNIAFGMQTAESAEQSFTISNTGEAVLTGLNLTLGKTGNAAEYSFRMTDSEGAAFTGTELAVGQTITVYVKQLFDVDNVGSKSDVLTIAADGQATKTINLTGTTRDGSVLYVDFDDPNAFPEGWQAGANWSVYTYGSDRYAYQSSSSTPSALVTTPLTVEDGQSLSFKVARNSSGYGYTTSLKTRFSQDGGATWSAYTAQYGTDSSNEAGSGWTTIELNELPAGNLIFEFYGNNIKLDMIQGLKVATAPALALTEGDAVVENGSTKDLGNLNADATVTYTLKNTGNAVLKSTITGEGVTVSPASVELAAGETAEITVTMAFGAPYGEKEGKMTIASEGWVGDVLVNFAATLVDPTDFVEDFSAGKPAGWYSEGWTYTTVNGNAYVYAGVNKPMITELVGAESGKNVLTFDAKAYYGEEEQTLNVYTSTDRKNWSEAQTFTLTGTAQNFSLSALADGNYYVKFEAANAVVDNIKGVKRLEAPEHDLYVTASTLPTGEYFVDTEITATATVTSLRADETGVFAELFVNDEVKAIAAEADITANGTKTFSMSYTAPVGSYTAYIKVYYSNGDVAFTTLSSSFEVVNYPALVLDETSSDPLSFATGTYDITLNRTFKAGWNTICLPFEVDVTDIHAEAVAFSLGAYNSETKELTFNKETATLSARTPYVIYVPEEITTPFEFKKQALNSYNATAGANTRGGITFQGTYAPIAAGDMTGAYGVTTDGHIKKAGSGASIKGFRAYFELNGNEVKALLFDGEDADAIRLVQTDAEEADAIYNVAGQRIQKMQRGINIVNGKKILK